MSSAKYWAFISYSHRDKSWGDWLHRSLERYRVPKPLVGRDTGRGEPVPARLFPVFRDREELPTSSQLGAVINAALEQSRYLVVICSRASAKSHWVNQEILQFKRLGRANRILAIIVDGEPNSAEQECFPTALKYELDAQGDLSQVRTEPIAADAREEADGKTNALLKLCAGLLGVNYDELKRRDEVQQRRRLQVTFGLAFLVIAAMGALAAAAVMQRDEAIVQRELAVKERQAAEFNLAQAELGRARQSLGSGDATTALSAALEAMKLAARSGRELETARWVLRRALDQTPLENRWVAHEKGVHKVFFDSSGARLLTFSADGGEAKVWAVPEGRLLATIAIGSGAQLAGWVGADELVTVRSYEKAIDTEPRAVVELAWWTAAGQQLRTSTVEGYTIQTLDWEADGFPTWIEVLDGGQSRLLRLADGKEVAVIPRPDSALVFVPSCQVAVALNGARGAQLFGLEDGKPGARLEGIAPSKSLHLRSAVCSLDGKQLAGVVSTSSGGNSSYAMGAWETSTGRQTHGPRAVTDGAWLQELLGGRLGGYPSSELTALAVALGRKAVAFDEYSVRTMSWGETATGEPRAALLRSGQLLLEWPASRLSRQLKLFRGEPSCVDSRADGSLGASGDDRGNVALFDPSPEVFVEQSLGPSVSELDKVSSGLALVKLGAERSVIWDVAARKELGSAVGTKQLGLISRWTEDDPWLVVHPWQRDARNTVSFYEAGTGRLLGERVGSGLVVAKHGRRAVLWGPSGWELIRPGPEGLTITELEFRGDEERNDALFAFSRDGTLFAATPTGQLHVFSGESGAAQRNFRFAAEPSTWMLTDLQIDGAGRHGLVKQGDQVWILELAAGGSRPILETSDEVELFAEGTMLAIHQVDRTSWLAFPALTPIASALGKATRCETLGDSGLLLLEGDDREQSVVEVKTGKERLRLTNVLDANAQLGLAVTRGEDVTNVIRLRDGEVIAQLAIEATSAVIARDGSNIALELTDDARTARVATWPLHFDLEQARARAGRLAH